jgi:maltose alpha-D-glucosyltransferase / alpha-amylase
LPAADLPADSSIPPALFYIEVNYGDGACDVYQVPLAFSTAEGANQIRSDRPVAIIATLSTPVGDALLHDASVREDLRQALLLLIERNAALELSTRRSAAVKVAASLAAAATGQPAREVVLAGSADELLAHPERATRAAPEDGSAQDGSVHLRPHEVFPVASTAETPPAPASSLVRNDGANAIAPHPLAGGAVEPLPRTAQPGEAAAPPRSDGHNVQAPNIQRLQPRESPSAGDPTPRTGVLTARASTAFAAIRGTQHLSGRVGSAEQSNTSILYGKQLILKLFRRLQPGENPDVEIGRFLTEVAHFPRIAPFLGEIDISPQAGEKTTIGMLQGLVANQGDGWEWFLNQLAAFFETVANVPAPMESPKASLLGEVTVPAELRQHAGPTLEAAALLGRRTAELHLALATPTRDPAFNAEPFSAEDLNRDALRIQDQIATAMEALKAKFTSLPDEIIGEAAVLLSRRRELLDRARDLAKGDAAGKRIRIHGDYHLGQTLRVAANTGSEPSAGDFVLLDFEGEPARSLAERRRKQSPLRDVAGMVRSFSYAAQSALAQFLVVHQLDSEINVSTWARLWENAAAAEFLRSYRTAISADPCLLPPPERAQALFAAYVLEKALYELLYELNNRPAWLHIPVAGILSM